MRPLVPSDVPRLLGLDDEAGFRALYRASMAPSAKLLEVFLCVLRDAGHEIGPVGRAHLDMAKRRATTYDVTTPRILEVVPEAQPVKGAAIAARYPAGIHRSFVDVDIFVPTPADGWRAAELLAGMVTPSEINVSVRRTTAGIDLFIGLSWPVAESILEAPYRMEFSTLAFLGDGAAVPARPGVPDTALARDLLLVAEEQFQRPMIARDIVDTAVLLHGLDESYVEVMAEAADEWRLSDEVKKLASTVSEVGLCDSGLAAKLARRLQRAADHELAWRQTDGYRPPPTEYGLPLGPGTHVAEPEFLEGEFGTILRSPLGSYLLVDDLDVDPVRYAQACVAIGAEPQLGEVQ